MKTKLTLNIDEKVVKKTKILSRKRKTSISAIVEEYLARITSSHPSDAQQGSTLEKIRKYTRPIQLSDEEAENRKNKYLSQKHGL